MPAPEVIRIALTSYVISSTSTCFVKLSLRVFVKRDSKYSIVEFSSAILKDHNRIFCSEWKNSRYIAEAYGLCS